MRLRFHRFLRGIFFAAFAGLVVLVPGSFSPLGAQSAAPRSATAPAANAKTPSAASAAPEQINAAEYVRQQFGASFRLDTRVAPMMGDLDGDGNEDLVLVATSPKPLDLADKYHYRVEDPYDGYFGVGNVKITSKFGIHLDGSGRDLLVVEGWRLPPAPPKKKWKKHPRKFVFINTPFQSVQLTPVQHKKKTRMAIDMVDNTSMRGYIQWTGRHWRWSPQGMVDDLPGFDSTAGSGAPPASGVPSGSRTY